MAYLQSRTRIAVLGVVITAVLPVFARGGRGRGATVKSSLDESTPGSVTFAFLVIFTIVGLAQTCNALLVVFRKRTVDAPYLRRTPISITLLLGTISLSLSYILGAVTVPTFYSSTTTNLTVLTLWTFTDRLSSLFIYGNIILILDGLSNDFAPPKLISPRVSFWRKYMIRRFVGVTLLSVMAMSIIAALVIHVMPSSGRTRHRGKIYRDFSLVYVSTYVLLAVDVLLSSIHLWMMSTRKRDTQERHKNKILSTIAFRICPLLMTVALFKLSVYIVQHVSSQAFIIDENILLLVTTLLEGTSMLIIIYKSCVCIRQLQLPTATMQASLGTPSQDLTSVLDIAASHDIKTTSVFVSQ